MALAEQAETDKADLASKNQSKKDADAAVVAAVSAAEVAGSEKQDATSKLLNTKSQFLSLINTLYGVE